MTLAEGITISLNQPHGWTEIGTVEGKCYHLPNDQSVIFYVSCVEITDPLYEFINKRIIFNWQPLRRFLYHSAYITETDLCGDRITFKVTDQNRNLIENSYIFPAFNNLYLCITSMVYENEFGNQLQKTIDDCINKVYINQNYPLKMPNP